MFNDEGECGTGAVVPWAGRLWAITYAPHKPSGSSDKLYEITPELQQIVRPESVGGTPANRMVHRESGQLFIGPYVIDEQCGVRVIGPDVMFGRLTGNARHLTDPANKLYYATMEEGIYEVDVRSLAVKELWADEQRKAGRHADLPGYHGKGLYSGQGRLVYANNGDRAKEALRDPTTPSGALAEWDGKADAWTVVRRNQFTEVTGPGGIEGNARDTDPLWTIGWDHRSLILMMLDKGQWHTFRLPKASHSYDGAHGWNTEWPRIRDIGVPGKPELLMTMHGMFWRFPQTFSRGNTSGIVPRSTYLKVIGDFCRWNDSIVLGCDDTAKNEFLNKRRIKGELAGPGQSQSNLWFVDPEQLDHLGPIVGRGAVWLDEPVKADEPSDPFLFAGFTRRGVHLTHKNEEPVTFIFEFDAGDGVWKKLHEVTVPAGEYQWAPFSADERGAWVRVRSDRNVARATALFNCSSSDERPRTDRYQEIPIIDTIPPRKFEPVKPDPAPMFASLAAYDAADYSGGVIRARGESKGTLAFAASIVRDGKLVGEGYYELDADLRLRKVDDSAAHAWLKEHAAVPRDVLSADEGSVLVVDDAGHRWRLPKPFTYSVARSPISDRVCREVCTERDLLHVGGTFYELPAENASGVAKMRAIATHDRKITDYCSWRGLLVMSGVATDAPASEHVVRSDDGQCALWIGAVDDLWQLGKPVGSASTGSIDGKANQPSDPILLSGYDHKQLVISHGAPATVTMRVEVDISGDSDWVTYRSFKVLPGLGAVNDFPEGFHAYWIRVVCDADCRWSAGLSYD